MVDKPVSYTHLDVYKRQPFALAGAFGRLDQVVAVLFAENAALLSVLPEEAVPAICRAGSMVADTVHRDGQNFFHW